jgi:hypothetical protein
MRILVLHDSYSPENSKSISGEDAIVDLEIEVLRAIGHEVIDLRQYDSGFKHKASHLLVHTSGTGTRGINADYLDSFKADIIHFYNLNLRTGYQWLLNTATPAVASLHNFRTLCPVAINNFALSAEMKVCNAPL